MRTVRALNRTQGTILASDISVASSIWARFWGLMGKRDLADGEGLLLSPCSSVHMFFMRFPIDVVFLDKSRRVTKVVSALRPWRVALGGGGHEALELPAGVAGGVQAGDEIDFEDADGSDAATENSSL